MYAYIEGQFSFKSPTAVHMDVGGIGFLIHISLNTFSKIQDLVKGKLYVHHYVKEDLQALYGFFTEEEKILFTQLISVSGIGPNTARIILSSMTPPEVRAAIVTENDLAFKKVKGVGPKTAKRVILDLKDKVKQGELIGEENQLQSDHYEKAITALIALGFQRNQVNKVMNKVGIPVNQSTEEIIKIALKHLT